MSEEKEFSKCEGGEEENVSVEFRVFGKKNERKVPGKKLKCLQWKLRLKLREKKIRDFHLLGSYPLVGRHVD